MARLSLGIEFVYTRQQDLLDRRQAGELDDDTLLRRLHYREEWGYPWDGYRDLLDTARRLGVRVLALDVGPRQGFDGLRRRDEHAARRI
ncbi:MAG: ChaN family lipoprotein, partial [Gammaproteobacteria bacterium]|nr:ChaN family lipoprotein [Gammaproteobacteria bacterium]